MAVYASEIFFLHFAPFELRLYDSGKRGGAGEDGDAGRVGIEAVGGARLLRRVNFAENPFERVAVVTTTRMRWQGSRFVDHNQGGIFVKDFNSDIHIGFALKPFASEVAFARAHEMRRGYGVSFAIENVPRIEACEPFALRNVTKEIANEIQK